MNPMKKSLPAYVLIVFAAMILIGVACNKTSSTSNTTKGNPNNIPADQMVTASLTGRVVDDSGVPVQGAAVTSGSASTTTDINGVFTFTAISMSSRFGYVQVSKSGYYTGSRSIITNPGASNFVSIQLTTRVETGTFSAVTGGSIAIAAGDTATFSDSAVVNASTNAVYTGTVHVFATYLDPTDPNLSKYMPGDLRGIGSDAYETALQSYGMLQIQLQDDAGNKLQLAPNHTAAITSAIPTTLQASAPANIALWYFNDSTGRWIQQGTATRNGNGYVGKVSHFTFWGADAPVSTVNFKVRLVDQNGNPLAYQYFFFQSFTAGISAGYTDSTGSAQGLIPKSESLVFQVSTDCDQLEGGINVDPVLADVDMGTVKINMPNTLLTLTGTVVDCSSQPVDSGMVSISIDGLNYNARVKNGAFTFALNRCNLYSSAVKLLATDLTTGQQGTSTSITATTGTQAVGQLSACGGVTVTQLITITVNGTNTYSWTSADNISCIYYLDQSNWYINFSATSNSNSNSIILNGGTFYTPGQAYSTVTTLNLPGIVNATGSGGDILTTIDQTGPAGTVTQAHFDGFVRVSATGTTYSVHGTISAIRVDQN